MSIIISQNGKDAKKIERSDFQQEDYLQNYIHENPESIPVYEINEDKRLFVAKREFPTNAGPIDALAVDKDGDIYIVETKLYKNPDKRTVVAQALDYGAALWKHMNDFSELINILNIESQKKFDLNFEEKAKDFFQLDDEQIQYLLDNLKRNLDDGNIKFVILMDTIGERLKDLILYVNQNSQFDIYAVQLEYYQFEKYEIMIPKIFGVEVKKNIRGSSADNRKVWNEQDFLAQTRERLGNNAGKIIGLYEYLKKKADKINWGTGNVRGSFSPIFNSLSKKISPFSVFTDGEVWIKWAWLGRDSDDKELVAKCAELFGKECLKSNSISLPKDYAEKDYIIYADDFIKDFDGLEKAIKKAVEAI